MSWAEITDEEWREFQAIPEQGHSHRAWVDGAIRKRIERLRTDTAIDRAAWAVSRRRQCGNCDRGHSPEVCGECWGDAIAVMFALFKEEP